MEDNITNDIEYYENLSILELEKIKKKKKILAQRYFNYEQAIKLMLNSIYGAFGNEYFYFYNTDIAETITIQGQNAILFTEMILNSYFQKFWHTDISVHEKMGIQIKGQVIKPVVIYIDTDSCYVSFQEIIEKSDWEGDEKTFILNLYKYRLQAYIAAALEKYAKSYNSDNFLFFELESVAKSGIWLAKKKYIQDLVWKDPDISFESLSKIKAKGFEIIQSSTPLFARTELKELLSLIFADNKNVKIAKIVRKLKKLKNKFKLSDIENISKNVRINNYTKYIENDYKTFEVIKGCPVHVRGAGYHNFIINNSKEYKKKYRLITSGEKVKMYYSMDKGCNVFSYIAGEFPYEIAPKIDMELQFEKVILSPINRVIHAIGLQVLDRNLLYSTTVF